MYLTYRKLECLLPDFLSLPVDAERTLDPGLDESQALFVNRGRTSSFFMSCTVLGEDGGLRETLPVHEAHIIYNIVKL